jgi:hypothetical protein
MIKYMDKVLIACLVFSAIAAIYLSVTRVHLLYVG